MENQENLPPKVEDSLKDIEKSKRLGDVLLSKGYVQEKELSVTLKELAVINDDNVKLGDLLIKKNLCTEKQITEAYAEQQGAETFNPALKKQMEPVFFEQHFNKLDGFINKLYDLDFVILGKRIEMVEGVEETVYHVAIFDLENINEIINVILSYFPVKKENIYPHVMGKGKVGEERNDYIVLINQQFDFQDTIKKYQDDRDHIPAFNLIMTRAYLLGTSDIHIEDFGKITKILYRIKGKRRQQGVMKTSFANKIINKVKTECKLEPGITRIPLDGVFTYKNDMYRIENLQLRVSIIPIKHDKSIGTSTVMRLLASNVYLQRNLNDFEGVMNDNILQQLRLFAQRGEGMMLVVGPTGSGKSTTLQAIMKEINREERAIITIEDPVETEQYGWKQAELQENAQEEKFRMTFQKVLKATMRHDPDVILIGEIRDEESAAIAIKAANTGHLVFGTLHSNNARATVARMLGLGTKPQDLSEALVGVLAQRLVPQLCDFCRKKSDEMGIERDRKLQQWLADKDCPFDPLSDYVKDPNGCSKCGYSGIKGVTLLNEYIDFTDEKTSNNLRENNLNEVSPQKSGPYPSFKYATIALYRKGVISLEDAIPYLQNG